jgi:long-chain acyl-CoA synthetase
MVFPYDDKGEETVAIQILPVVDVVKERLGHEPSEEELDKYFTDLVKEFNQKLAAYKRIKYVFVRKQDFVRTTTRKIRRQDNPVSAETVIGFEA